MSSIDGIGPTAAELVEAMAPLQRRIAAQQAELASLVAAYADRRVADDQAERSPDLGPPGRPRPGEFVADEVSLALTVSVWEARRLLARALRLRASMPTVWAASLDGVLDQPRVASIDAAARLILDDHVRAILDDTVVEVAKVKTVKQLEGWLERFLAVQEPEAYAHRHQMTFAERNVSVRPGLEGVRFLSAMVSAPDAFLIDTRLDRLARSCGAGDPRSVGQRRSDLFSDLLLDRVVVQDDPALDLQSDAGTTVAQVVEVEVIDTETGEYLGTRVQAIDSEGAPIEGAPGRTTLVRRDGVPVTMGVVVPLSTLTGDSELPGQLADRSACLSAEQARELAAQPGTLFYRLLTDDRGFLLDVTRIGRFATGQLGFAVRLRSGTCGFPTCTVPADRCDLDHHEPAPSGPTAAANLDPASRRHHRAKTHGGFRSWREGQQTFWTTPTEHTYRRRDEPLLV